MTKRTGNDGGAAPHGTPDPKDAGRATTPQRDEASSTVPAQPGGRDAPYRDLKLPHERDETGGAQSTQASESPRDVTRQGAADVQSGQQDTDCYNATAPRYKAREDKLP